MNVRVTPIGDLVEPVETWNPCARPEALFSYVDLSAVDQAEKKIIGADQVRGGDAPSRARQLVRSGDILISTVRPNLNGVAPVTEEFDGATVSTGFCVLRSKVDLLDPRYLMHWVRSETFVESMVREATGASYPAVSDRVVKASQIPLPPLDEQRRIAAILDKADALRRKRKRTLDLLDTLPRSVFADLFLRSSESYASLQSLSLGDVCHIIRDGTHKTPTYVERGVPFVTVKNIVTGRLNLSDTKYISMEEHRDLTRRVAPAPGDVLVSKDGTIGVPCVVPDGPEFSIFVSVALLRPKKDLIDCHFLVEQIRTEAIQKQIRDESKGIAIRHLHLGDFAKLRIFSPPLKRQADFVRSILLIDSRKAQLQTAYMASCNLFASLQHRAFSGQL